MAISVRNPDSATRGTGRPIQRGVDDQAFRRQFASTAIWNRMVAAGDRLPDLPLLEVDLGPIHLHRLRDTGPVVLMFVRHASSPDCDAALRSYRDVLAPGLTAHDAHLVAVSPQAPARLEPHPKFGPTTRKLGCRVYR